MESCYVKIGSAWHIALRSRPATATSTGSRLSNRRIYHDQDIIDSDNCAKVEFDLHR